MRRAGRALPEYMGVGEKTSFSDLCKTPELAAEVTLQPLRRFGFDAAIRFSDILVLLEPMGASFHFGDKGPGLEAPLRDEAQIAALRRAGQIPHGWYRWRHAVFRRCRPPPQRTGTRLPSQSTSHWRVNEIVSLHRHSVPNAKGDQRTRGRESFAGTVLRVLCTNDSRPLFQSIQVLRPDH